LANAKLMSIELERFKSYAEPTLIELAPLTIVLGRNNSGKSSIIQALLLLKQTLALPRPDVPLRLEGMVDALSLRQLTFGWPELGQEVEGPSLKLRWTSEVDVQEAMVQARWPDPAEFMSNTGIFWLAGADLEDRKS
jgi:hypothetical protein